MAIDIKFLMNKFNFIEQFYCYLFPKLIFDDFDKFANNALMD